MITIQALLPTYQEARGVVQEAAETTDKASLQEGGVLWRKFIWVVIHKVPGDITTMLHT